MRYLLLRTVVISIERRPHWSVTRCSCWSGTFLVELDNVQRILLDCTKLSTTENRALVTLMSVFVCISVQFLNTTFTRPFSNTMVPRTRLVSEVLSSSQTMAVCSISGSADNR